MKPNWATAPKRGTWSWNGRRWVPFDQRHKSPGATSTTQARNAPQVDLLSRKRGHGPECPCADCRAIAADIEAMKAVNRIGTWVRDGCEGRPSLLDD